MNVLVYVSDALRIDHLGCYGARFLKRTIEDRLKLPISQHWTEGDVFTASLVDGHIQVEVTSGAGGAYSSLAATA